jgi:hypothetical protein
MPGENYTLDLGVRLLVVISPVIAGIGGTLASATLAWLDATLAAASKPCTIMCHYPLPNSVGHYAPGLEAQIGAQDLFQIEPRDQLLAILATHAAKVGEWICGPTHSALDTVGLVNTYALGDPFTLLSFAGYPNLAATMPWLAYVDAGATVNEFVLTGGIPTRFRASSSAASQRAMVHAQVATVPGNWYLVAADFSVAQMGANGQYVQIAWQDGANLFWQRLFTSKAVTTGQHRASVVARCPPGTSKMLVRVGNEDFGRLANGEVSEFDLTSLHVCNLGNALPSEMGSLVSINASAPTYTGTSKTVGLETEPIAVIAVTIADDGYVEVRAFDAAQVAPTPLTIGGERVVRLPVAVPA